ncbi:YIP1 family protein [Candidatus Micrarchaeota archaeon]|nr:YIP1 family protein [Candidatus Micrarchaeota archaeon]MBU1930609.1 YIP1 family protein [Candidatus Micrarchaeota archaeon]
MSFFDIITQPRNTMEGMVSNANTNDAIKTYAIYGAVIGFLIGLGIAILASLISLAVGTAALNQVPALGFLVGLGLLAIIIVPIIMAIVLVIVSAVSWGILTVIARLLGGTGTFTQNYFLASRLLWPMFVISIIVSLISLIPIIGPLINILWLLYALYLSLVVLSVANKISTVKAFIVWIIPVIVVILIMVLLFSSAIMLLTTMGSSGFSGGIPPGFSVPMQ